VVVDADGLNALAPFPDDFRTRPTPLVLTPHPGEFARLAGVPTHDVVTHREELAVRFAARAGVVLLLKGTQTVVSDGRRLYRNSTGNPGMATGGSGDVLTGVVAALLAQGLAPFDAAMLAAWVHGRAGDLAAAALGQTGLTAADLPDALPAAFRELEARRAVEAFDQLQLAGTVRRQLQRHVGVPRNPAEIRGIPEERQR
ncbi:MAG: NAD(P)H-hydrate dehydratase, partial [Rhodospirillales bacterium]|nr:NAD(P)H-hydrate dehydratase [Rhodospirillales bacterium]